MKNQYVILTGSKNNAGDYLIKYRAKKLFSILRPDRKIIDFDGWKPLSDQDLSVVNESKALILVGGPALQNRMYPRVYGLRKNLDDIKVPIMMMGVGWYSKSGRWEDTYNYKLDENSLRLLKKIADSGFLSSVRDYHTLNTLQNFGIKNVLMTGCPALYEADQINQVFSFPNEIKKIGYSLGVSMNTSENMKRQMKQVLITLKDMFPDAEVVTVFHHSIAEDYLQTDGATKKLYKTHLQFKDWLEENDFAYVDISGSAENLMEFYDSCNMHVGYRVHAHIFMSSISKLSVLLNEDGRGRALEKVIGGKIIDAYKSVQDSLWIKILHKLGLPFDNFVPNRYLVQDLQHIIEYELDKGIKFSQPRVEIDRHFNLMKQFIAQLP